MSTIFNMVRGGYYGTSSTSGNMFSSLLGSSSSTSGTDSLGLGDYNLIRSGAYKKAIKAYYSRVKAENGDSNETIQGSGKADSQVNLSTVKNSASKLSEAAEKLKKTDYSKVESGKDLYADAKAFVDAYNSTVNSTKKLNSYSILQTAVWGTERVGASEAALSDIGITIKEDNTLAIDEDKFSSADVGRIKSLFGGKGSLADQVSAKASAIVIQSTNQLSINSGKTIYSSSGIFL